MMLDEKCTPRYLTICLRDKASPLSKENGSWEEAFCNKEAFNAFGIVYVILKVYAQRSKLQDERSCRPAPLVGNFAVTITKHTFIHILQQSAVSECEGVSMREKL